ncbi:MAG: THUMP domain-containing protein [Sulfolobales archaeon]
MECPKIIITAKAGKEDRVKEELEDLLYKLDPNILVKKTRYRDLLEIFSRVDADRLFREIRERPPYASLRAVKVDLCIDTEIKKIIDTCIELLKRVSEKGERKIRVECSKRGSYVESCKAIEIAVGTAIERSGIAKIDLKKPTDVIKIEIIDDLAYIGVMHPGSDKLHRIDRSLYERSQM